MRHRLLVSLTALCAFGVGVSAQLPAKAQTAARETRSTYTYKRVGQLALSADVHRLPGADVRPAILWLHGGALIFGDRATVTDHQLERYLRAGYVVVTVDYRLAPETKLPAIVEDVRDAYAWLREQGPGLIQIDPDRIALIGNSAGAYLALWAGSAVTPRPRAVVSFYGYGDITREWTTRPSPFYVAQGRIAKKDAYAVVGRGVLAASDLFPRVTFYNYCRQNGLWPMEVVGADGPSAAEILAKFSPSLHVSADFPPTMLLHGTKDNDVPFDESERMAAALTKQKIPYRFLRMQGYDHLFDLFPEGWLTDKPPSPLKDPRVIAAFDTVLQFLGEHVAKRR